jgi:REP element-mobilizing transposase RayT
MMSCGYCAGNEVGVASIGNELTSSDYAVANRSYRAINDFQRHVDFIHWNPVKHGYVRHVADWPYSIFYRYVE